MKCKRCRKKEREKKLIKGLCKTCREKIKKREADYHSYRELKGGK